MEMPLIHQLAYSWTGWPKSGALPTAPADDLLASLDAAWAGDGLTRISHRWSPDRTQFTFHAGPHLAPATIAARAKGRLDHALRQAGWRHGFSRKISLRALGENTLDIVLAYIATQLDRAELADPRYLDSLAAAAWENPAFDLADPSPSAHGRYWFDLHLVAVTDSRWRVGREDFLDRIRPCVLAWGDTLATGGRDPGRSPGVRSLAVMPDHIHLAVRGPHDRSPADLAGDLWRHLNRAAGCRLFSDEIYVGTFSEYPLAAIRR
ncbi:MAG: hypothetical protein HKN82_01160 [Akkermansiaceae bacterium]|nr:hypothetical protein [Akkermansiaceae bacterium]